MRGTKHASWVMMGLVTLAVGCQPETEPSTPSTGSPLASRAEALTPGSWTVHSPMVTRRAGHTATLLDLGGVLVTGGYNFYPTRSAELYERLHAAAHPGCPR